jgi:predicted O-methyltransferase YrrM
MSLRGFFRGRAVAHSGSLASIVAGRPCLADRSFVPDHHHESTNMDSSILSPQITNLLDRLYTDAAQQHRAGPPPSAAARPEPQPLSERERFAAMKHAYMAVNRPFGNLLYALVGGMRARTVVEFGTSFGLSTIFLAAGLRDNGAGKVITTEFEASKAERARANLAEAGLDGYVDIRVGDALETLKTDPPKDIDLVFLDGAKSMYFDVLRLLEPALRPGALVASDNTDHDGMEHFLAYLRDPRNGYLSSPLLTARGPRGAGHDVSVRVR